MIMRAATRASTSRLEFAGSLALMDQTLDDGPPMHQTFGPGAKDRGRVGDDFADEQPLPHADGRRQLDVPEVAKKDPQALAGRRAAARQQRFGFGLALGDAL